MPESSQSFAGAACEPSIGQTNLAECVRDAEVRNNAPKARWIRRRYLPVLNRGLPSILMLCLAAVGGGLPPSAGDDLPSRPRITGIAYVRIYSTNLDNSRTFYGKILGLAPAKAGCPAVAQSCFSINDHQQIEITAATTPPKADFLAEVAFSTEDVGQMRRYLTAHGVALGAISQTAGGRPHFELLDPEGHPIAFIQTSPRTVFKPGPEQLSTRLFHAGFVVHDSRLEDRFYRDLLGFRMYWRGGFKDADIDWEEIQVPDGNDWIEYMLNIPSTADHRELGVQNHFSLGVLSAKATVERIHAHGLRNTDEPEIGRDGKWAVDIYDPDATRVEFMEFSPAQKPCCHPYTASHPTP
jgi:catechol 2,3-dioxygenase-like lactoylglutathione lyase family enzyme